ncbi:MAG: MBL fold metallo-hydrolase [Spirochaetia bacterium]|jgi:metallo-beta-lactamase family protein|nr:MBL fold metallo-hydrolase [Spirochaetia bacterium]
MDIYIRALGAAGEVTGSKHLVEFEGKRILVDCGAFQGRRAESDAKNRALLGDIEPSSVDAVVLSHAHYDHCGLLPYLVKKGFEGNIFATSATRDLANLIMMDSAHIQARDADYLSRQAAKKNEKFDWKPLYNDLDVVKTMGQFVTINYRRPINVLEGVSIEFLDAGHILGSALVKMTLKARNGEQRVLGFSGDLGRKNKPIIRDPEHLHGVDHLVLESTYGNKLHENTSDAIERLAQVVRSTVEAGGKVIIPAFAVERTQELVFTLHLLLDKGRIPDIPIWVDSPMAVDATGIFRIHPECYDKETHDAFTTHSKNPFGFASLHFSRSVEDSKALNAAKESMIVISADGMCEVGRIQHHLIHNISNPQNTILIVGYMAEGTLGRRIKDGVKEVRIHGDFYRVAADVKTIDAFSAHADWQETLDWLSETDISTLKSTLLVHGESKALDAMKEKLQGAGLSSVEIARPNQRYRLT